MKEDDIGMVRRDGVRSCAGNSVDGVSTVAYPDEVSTSTRDICHKNLAP